MSIKVPRGTVDEELAVVQSELAADSSPVYLPKIFLKMGLQLIRLIERELHLNVEPRVGIDMALAARSKAQEHCSSVVSLNDMIEAVPAAVLMNAPPVSESDLTAAANLLAPNAAQFLQSEIPDFDFSDFIKKLHACGADTTQAGIKKALLATSLEELALLTNWIIRHEALPNFRIYEVIAEYLGAYKEGVARELKTRKRSK